MATRFDDWEGEYLAHFGVRGMRWGQRRYQNPDGSLTALGRKRYGVEGSRSARGMTHDLNKLDKEQAYAKKRISTFDKKVARLDRRIAKAEQSGNAFKAEKIASKKGSLEVSRKGKKTEKYRELLNKSKNMTNSILENASRNGYTISSKPVRRHVNKGRAFAVWFFASQIGGLVYQATQTSPGTKYKVRKNKDR